MRLADWRKAKGWTQAELARALGVTQPYVSTMERSRKPAIPGPGLMAEIYNLTAGEVGPNDFYELPTRQLHRRKAA